MATLVMVHRAASSSQTAAWQKQATGQGRDHVSNGAQGGIIVAGSSMAVAVHRAEAGKGRALG